MNVAFPEMGEADFAGLAAREKQANNPPVNSMTALWMMNPPIIAGSIIDLHKPGLMSKVTISELVERTAAQKAIELPLRLRQKIKELATLGPNWDGEDAKPIKPHVLADMVETLKRLNQQIDCLCEPFLVPTFDGFVQMEWRERSRSLDIEAVENGWSAVGTMIGSDGQRLYFTSQFERNDFGRLKKFYQWLYADELIWPSL